LTLDDDSFLANRLPYRAAQLLQNTEDTTPSLAQLPCGCPILGSPCPNLRRPPTWPILVR